MNKQSLAKGCPYFKWSVVEREERRRRRERESEENEKENGGREGE